ncbi:uncharacterized protein K460DRAFT_404923 [Cucurbitaria berberidis CBS 394.84]|uniref:Uncharacterized protein n=1 Tax=Cucurbitaria berberidis CBS 394.84 TaxID=1168544 RepID=A0A9P4GEP5_9PLEO|nr:uncharacterized protein K460DRAFT_404923 [Cucurbitaria berberidis CBS 394.84]KAF1844638.1 hypothetical protein K460DRAFT_404923 [Cucurbitaria berberidis CBS 394.84]
MSSTVGFSIVPDTLAAARAVSTSFATVTTTTTATDTFFETVRSTAYTTLTSTATAIATAPATATATAASTNYSSNLKRGLPLTLLNNARIAYTSVYHQALRAGTAKYALADELPVLNWVLLGVLGAGAGAGLQVLRRYRTKTPPVPIPLGQDGLKWRMIARAMTGWLQRALKNNTKLRQDLQRAQQEADDTRLELQSTRRNVADMAPEIHGALQQEDVRDNIELRQELQNERATVADLRQHIQHAEELEKMQDEEIAASLVREEELQHNLTMETTWRKQLEQEVAHARAPELEASTTPARHSSNRSPLSISASSPMPSSVDQTSARRERAITPTPWNPLGSDYESSSKRRATPQQDYGAVYSSYESVERMLHRSAGIEYTPLNQRKRRRTHDGEEEIPRPAKLHRSSPAESSDNATYTPKGTPTGGASFRSKRKQKMKVNADVRLWGLDGKPSIIIEPSRHLPAPIKPERLVIDNTMADSIMETTETPANADTTRSPSRARSRLPIASTGSPVRRSTRAATKEVQSLNERDLASRSTSPTKDDLEDALQTMGRKYSKPPARQTRSVSPKKGEKKRDALTSPVKSNGHRISKPLASPKKK